MQIAKQNLLVVGSHYILKYLASELGIDNTGDRQRKSILFHLIESFSKKNVYGNMPIHIN